MKRVMFSLLAAFGLASALAAQETGNPPIARIGEVEYSDFVSFFAAFQAIPANTRTEVALLADVVVPGVVPVAAGQVIDFDLNGYRFETTTQPDNASRHYYAINNYGTLTINDSSTGKTGVIYARGVQNLGAGTLTVKGGEIVSCDANGGAAIWNEATLTITGGTFTTEFVGTPGDDYGPGCLNNQGTALITGGTFTSDNRRTYAIISTGKLEITPAEGAEVTVFGAHGALSSDGGTAVVNGGSYTSTEYYGLYVSNDGRNSETMQAAVTVNGGTFDGKMYSVWIGSDVNNPVNSTILITGGTFLDPLNRQDVAREDAIVITGGTFSVAPPAEFYPEGSVTTESGTIGYPSLAAAVNANRQGQTITLLKDLENQGAITIWSAGQETVIDLNGHTITFRNDESGDHRFQLLEGALTLTGTGTVTESKPAYGPMIIWASAEDAPDKCVLNVGPDVTLKGYQGVMIQGSNGNLKVGHGVSVTVEGKIVTMPASEDDPGCGVYINGQLQDTEGNVPKIVLAEGSSITTGGTGIYAAGYAEWTLAGNITAQEPLSIKCGTFDITGGTYHANGPFNDPAEANGNGSEPTGAAVSITTNDGYAPKTVVNITGGTFTSENGYAFYEGIAKDADGIPAAEASTAAIAISGGTFSGSTTNEAIKDSSAIAITTAENKRVISGGYFATPVPEAFCEYGYSAVDEANGEGYYTVEHPQFTKIGVRLADGSYAVYDNFYAAYYVGLAQAGYKGTLVVLEDQETDASMNLMHDSTATAEVTLDLNGHTLTFTAGQYAIDCVRQDSSRSKPSLVITDSSAMQTGTIRATGAALDGVVRMVGGTLTITGGRFVQAVDDPNAQYKNNIFVVTEGMTIAPEGWRTVEISGGTIRIEHSNVADVAEQGTAIKGGTFHSEAGRPAIEVAHATEGLVVSGGEFVGEGEALRISAPAAVTVSGGDFADDTIAVADSGATLTLKDGRFDGATLAADNVGTLAIVGGPIDLSSAKIGDFATLSLQGEVAIGTNRLTQTAVAVDGASPRRVTLALTEEEATAGVVDVLSAAGATAAPENLRFFVPDAPTDTSLTAETVVADNHIRYVFTYLPIRVAGETTGEVFPKAVREALVAAAAEQGTRGILESVTGESAGKALTTAQVNDALACFEGDGLVVVADGQSLKVGYAFGIVGASYKAGTLTVTAQVRDLAGEPLAFANAEGLTLVDAATGDPIVGASAQVDEVAPGTVTFTAELASAPETLRLAVKASTPAAD